MTYYHAVTFSTDEYKKVEVVCTTRSYNKFKKMPNYRELDHAKFSGNPMHIQHSIDYKIEEMGLSRFTPSEKNNGCVMGELGTTLYGYAIYR